MSIVDNIKDIANVVRKADSIDLYRQILDLQQEALELVEENINLKNEIREFKNKMDLQEKLTFHDNMYFINNDDENDGPYCTTCWDSENKLVRLHELSYGGHICNACYIKGKK